MSLLIDGYNLLHASGILGGGVGPGGLERSRGALLNFLAESLDAGQLAGTTVVFDARDPPPGLPREIKHRGITVRFAERGSDADLEIEQLIAADSAPRRLTVVSSDHRLHRAARRRKAKAVDSDKWYAQVLRERIDRARTKSPGRKPSEPASESEVRFWLRQFGVEETDAAAGDESIGGSPFPPGYGEDVRDED
jgi:predicted RNA-binding protein with PIN domain